MEKVETTLKKAIEILGGSSTSKRKFLAKFGAVAAGFSMPTIAAAQDTSLEAGSLEFYNWDTYIGDRTLANFRRLSNRRVELSLFATNEELLNRIRSQRYQYDVIMPSNEYLQVMIDEGLLQPLNHGLIPNRRNIATEFQNPNYDNGLRYSTPYTFLMLGIGYRKSKMKNGIPPTSWKSVFDDTTYSGRIALLNENLDIFRLANKYLGQSINQFTTQSIAAVRALLIRQAPHVKLFHSDDGQDLLVRGEVDIAVEYNGDIAQAAYENEDVGFAYPSEGSILITDSMCIPRNAKRPILAHYFINFILDGQVGKEISSTILYPTPNLEARRLSEASYRDNPTIFPSKEAIDSCEFSVLPEQSLKNQIEVAYQEVLLAHQRKSSN